jgi:hypothetical protein
VSNGRTAPPQFIHARKRTQICLELTKACLPQSGILHIPNQLAKPSHRENEVTFNRFFLPPDVDRERLEVILDALSFMKLSRMNVESGADVATGYTGVLVNVQTCEDENPHTIHQHTSALEVFF